MIKFSVVKNGKNIIGIGLSRRNLELLAEGRPLLINAKEMRAGDVDEIFIFGGTTEKAMLAEMEGAIGPDTIVRRFDERDDGGVNDDAG